MVIFDEDVQKRKLQDLRRTEEEDIAKILSEKYGHPYLDLTGIPIEGDALKTVSEEDSRNALIAPIDVSGKRLKVALVSPGKSTTESVIKNLENAGFHLDLFVVSKRSLEKVWSRYQELSHATESTAGALDISSEGISKTISEIKYLPDVQTLLASADGDNKSFRISRLIETALAGSLATEASDIHFEPEEDHVRLRYRLDGVLHDIYSFDKKTFNLILSRIKLLAGLKLNVKEGAQDGRFSVLLQGADIEIRASSLPGAYGESVVLRLLNPKNIAVPLEDLGMSPAILEIINKAITKPNGMMLTTGPTGSGKTTTLYACLKKVHESGTKIITIEDPIEYHLPGIVQTQVNPEKNYTFLEGLRSALRQDPDIIMVGEIRDKETASIAINAAQTGHLVFSTLHTNSAAGAFPRLIDLGVDPKIIVSAITVSLAQRLLRKLCSACKKETPIPEEISKFIKEIIAGLPVKELGEKHKDTKNWFIPVGCAKCNKTGYKGRSGIYEAVIVDRSIEKLVRESGSERDIKDCARAQGIMTMREDGIVKVLEGVTSFEELRRVINIEEF